MLFKLKSVIIFIGFIFLIYDMKKERKILSISDVITNSSSEVFLIDGKNVLRKKSREITKDKVLSRVIDIAADCKRRDYGGSDWKYEKEEIIKYKEVTIDEDWDSMYQLFLNCYVAPEKQHEFTEEDFLKLFPYIYSVEDARERIVSILISDGLADAIRDDIKPFILDKNIYSAIYGILYPNENYDIMTKIEKYRENLWAQQRQE